MPRCIVFEFRVLAFEIDIQNGHVEIEGRFAVFLVFIADAQEFTVQQDLDGVRCLRTRFDADGRVAECAAQIILNLDHFVRGDLHAVSPDA